MNMIVQQASLIVAVLALLISVLSLIYTRISTERLWKQITYSDLDISIEDEFEWEYGKTLTLSIKNLGEISAKNIEIEVSYLDDEGSSGHIKKPFSLLGSSSNDTQKSVDISSDLSELFVGLDILKVSSNNRYGVKLTEVAKKPLSLQIEATWESGIYNLESRLYKTVYYDLIPSFEKKKL